MALSKGKKILIAVVAGVVAIGTTLALFLEFKTQRTPARTSRQLTRRLTQTQTLRLIQPQTTQLTQRRTTRLTQTQTPQLTQTQTPQLTQTQAKRSRKPRKCLKKITEFKTLNF